MSSLSFSCFWRHVCLERPALALSPSAGLKMPTAGESELIKSARSAAMAAAAAAAKAVAKKKPKGTVGLEWPDPEEKTKKRQAPEVEDKEVSSRARK